jgi:sigma-B regulation protein RsbU (phosphoserine phosphatase)
MNFIQTLLNIVVVAIENIRLFENSLKQEAMKKELELASKMQSMLIPDNNTLPQNDKIFVSGFYLPHLEVGGDYYDCMKLNEDDYGFCIADVSGKGISAALLMANFQATLRALFNFNISLDKLVLKLNESVLSSANGEKFITLFIGKYYGKTKVLEYINAAHNPPVFYEPGKKKITKFNSGSVGLGMLDEMPSVDVFSEKITETSKLICYTDGLSELPDDDGNESGTKAMEECIRNTKRVDVNIQELISSQKIVEGNSRIFDDVSILGIQFYV